MTYDTLLFDLDGTLVDSAPDIHRCVNMALADCGLEQIGMDETRKAIGPSGDGFRLAILKGRRDLLHMAEEVEGKYRDYYWEGSTEETRPYAGITETLVGLKERGIGIALTTNKPLKQSERIMDRLGLGEFMDTMLGPESVSRPKPEGDMLLAAVEMVGGSVSSTLMVGDTDNDLLAARAARMDICMVRYGYMDEKEWENYEPEHIIDHPLELLDIVDSPVTPSDQVAEKRSLR